VVLPLRFPCREWRFYFFTVLFFSLDFILFMFYGGCMDTGWDMAINRNRLPLLRIVATLFAAIGLAEGGTVERLAWPLYRAVLSILQSAEAAVRRLIVVAARNLVVKPPKARPAPAKLKRSGKDKSKGQGRMSFRLFDPRKRFDWVYDPFSQGPDPEPRLDGDAKGPLFRASPPVAPAPAPDGTVSAASLCRRLAAIKAALDDLAAQARRYARWRAKPVERRRPRVTSPLRPGPPPGQRKKPSHEVDHILAECHWLAHTVPVPEPDTS
jgi:hypothetical protein